MGVDQNLTPCGFRKIILKEALKELLNRGSFFVLELHAKNVALIDFYKKFGFVQLVDSPLHIILPKKQIIKAYD